MLTSDGVVSSPQREVRRPQQRGADRRQRILAAALATFAARGTRRTSIADVAVEAGISAQGVLYHFGTKEALIAEVVTDLELRRDAAIIALAGTGGVAMLRNLADAGDEVAGQRNLALLNVVVAVENIDADDPHHDLFARRRYHDRAVLEEGVRRGVERGEFRADVDAARVAEEMAALMAGAWLNWLLEPNGSHVGRIYRSYFEDLERRLSPFPSGSRAR
jgi:AcrR family transcriptional regulator